MGEDIVDEEDAGEDATIASSVGGGEAVSGHNGRLQVGVLYESSQKGNDCKAPKEHADD